MYSLRKIDKVSNQGICKWVFKLRNVEKPTNSFKTSTQINSLWNIIKGKIFFPLQKTGTKFLYLSIQWSENSNHQRGNRRQINCPLNRMPRKKLEQHFQHMLEVYKIKWGHLPPNEVTDSFPKHSTYLVNQHDVDLTWCWWSSGLWNTQHRVTVSATEH